MASSNSFASGAQVLRSRPWGQIGKVNQRSPISNCDSTEVGLGSRSFSSGAKLFHGASSSSGMASAWFGDPSNCKHHREQSPVFRWTGPYGSQDRCVEFEVHSYLAHWQSSGADGGKGHFCPRTWRPPRATSGPRLNNSYSSMQAARSLEIPEVSWSISSGGDGK